MTGNCMEISLRVRSGNLPTADPIAQSRTAVVFALITTLTAVSVSLFLVFFHRLPLNFDCAILLDCGRLLVMGRIPYVDYVEINPPIAHYVHALPVLVANLLNGDIAVCFQALVLCLSIYSSAALFLVVSRLSPEFSLAERLFLVAAWQSFTVLMMLWTHFGQREHLFMLAYIPWLYCREARHSQIRVPWELSAVIGLVAGPMFLLKPHFCLLIAVVEAGMLLRSRRISTLWAAETLVVVAWSIVYAAHFLFIPSAMREAFFSRWLPFVAANYEVYRQPLSTVLTGLLRLKVLFVTVVLVGSLMTLVATKRTQTPARGQVEVLTLGLCVSYGHYLIQLKGWTYHLIPAMGFAILLVPTVLIALSEAAVSDSPFRVWLSDRARVPIFCASCLGLTAICAVMTMLSLTFHGMPTKSDAIVPAIRAYTKRADSVLVISTSVEPAYPALLQEKRLPGSRYLKSFPIAMLYKGVRPQSGTRSPYRAAQDILPEEKEFLGELGDDVLKNRPKLIIVSTQMPCQGCPEGFRIDEYLSRSGWMERFMSGYTFVEHLPGNDLYVRGD